MGGGGGVSGAQKNAAATGLGTTASTATTDQAQQYAKQNAAQDAATGFYTNEMNKGLPFYRNLTDYNSGTIAQAFAPARAQVMRQTSQYGTNMPSGYRDALLTSLGAQQGRDFDSSLAQTMMAQQLAKQQGAAGVQGQQTIAGQQAMGYGGQGAQANEAVLTGPQKPSGWGIAGGVAQAGLTAAAAF